MKFESVIGPSWPGSAALKHLVIFGDSYSAVGYSSISPHPTRDRPLGVTFPGITFNEPRLPNWVGHFITERPNLLAYDYAVGGATVASVNGQVFVHFSQSVGQRPEWAPWTAEDTLFVTWVGINDCAFTTDCTKTMTTLLTIQEGLYAKGARNFLFIDVPPIDRSPAVKATSSDFSDRFINWNTSLHEMISKFYAAHSDITALVFSSWDVFTRILDDPVAHGFSKDDIQKFGGKIWRDHVHPTSKVHEIVAKEFSVFLDEWPAFVNPSLH